MDVSIWLDFRAVAGVPPAPGDYEDGVALVRAADRLGFHQIWTTEQHGVDDGYLPAQLPMLAALARETERIRLGTGVILLPLTHPRHVVEAACVVDVLSHGRLTLGIGTGNYPNEFRIFGVDMADRARLMDEGVAFIASGLSGGELPDGSRVNVPPVQRPIPLVLGGMTRPAIERAARLADGHFDVELLDVADSTGARYDRLIAPALERHERGRERFRLILGTFIWASDRADEEWRETVGPAFGYQQRKYQEWEEGVPSAGGYAFSRDLRELRDHLLIGTPAEVADGLRAARARYPFDEVVFWARLPGIPAAMAQEHLERVAAEVVPALAG